MSTIKPVEPIGRMMKELDVIAGDVEKLDGILIDTQYKLAQAQFIIDQATENSECNACLLCVVSDFGDLVQMCAMHKRIQNLKDKVDVYVDGHVSDNAKIQALQAENEKLRIESKKCGTEIDKLLDLCDAKESNKQALERRVKQLEGQVEVLGKIGPGSKDLPEIIRSHIKQCDLVFKNVETSRMQPLRGLEYSWTSMRALNEDLLKAAAEAEKNAE